MRGTLPRPAAEKEEVPKRRSRKELYQAQNEANKTHGQPFFPDIISHDALVALIVLAAIFILAIVFPASITAPANPTGTAYTPRPEWYFIFLQQWLRFFPGVFEFIGGVLIPLLVIVILILLPFFNRGLNRTFRKRKTQVAIGAVAVAGVVALEITGILFPPTIPTPESPPPPPSATFQQVADLGKPAYENSCAACHGSNGAGGLAPAVWGLTSNLEKFQNAKALNDYNVATMPDGAPGSLSRAAYLNILAYMLVQNNDVPGDAMFNEEQLPNIPVK